MDFYRQISNYYDHIFPLNRSQIDFIKTSFLQTEHKSFLDIGCGTGHLAMELSPFFDHITAIDLDEAMVEKAKLRPSKERNNLEYKTLNMLSIDRFFDKESLNGIACFGNTLVHLPDSETVLSFLQKCSTVLKPMGKLQIQIINYDRIIDKNIDALPTIENDIIMFKRDYLFHPSINKLDFKTTLIIKDTGEKIENTIALYPIRKKELHNLLQCAGFKNIAYFGDFKRGALHENSIPLIVEVTK